MLVWITNTAKHPCVQLTPMPSQEKWVGRYPDLKVTMLDAIYDMDIDGDGSITASGSAFGRSEVY